MWRRTDDAKIITEIAKDVESLVSFQRNPQYSVPSGQGPVTPEYRKYINENYMELWEQAKNRSMFAFGLEETSRQTFSVDETERKQIYEKAWSRGGGFRFMFETFGDIVTNEAANKEAADFIKEKILQTVKDPEKARKLLPTQMYARRPLCDAGYYEQFNRENVEVVSLHDTPIDSITPAGILTADGKEHNFDMIIFATGFDAVDGNYTRIAIEGRHGSLKTHWEANGPTSYLGMSVPGFPNMFMITGPNGPFCNLPPAIETQVEFISDTIRQLEERPSSVIEATVEAEREWMAECDRLSVDSLFRKTDSWIFGANVPGKKHAVLFYFAGLAPYRKVLRDVVENGWRGYTIA
jgi:cation diffusion facilitator CzcD-associated flavoprotein CzcO